MWLTTHAGLIDKSIVTEYHEEKGLSANTVISINQPSENEISIKSKGIKRKFAEQGSKMIYNQHSIQKEGKRSLKK